LILVIVGQAGSRTHLTRILGGWFSTFSSKKGTGRKKDRASYSIQKNPERIPHFSFQFKRTANYADNKIFSKRTYVYSALCNRIETCNLLTGNSSYLLFWESLIHFWEARHSKPGSSEHFQRLMGMA
jgi:hypothetical protein